MEPQKTLKIVFFTIITITFIGIISLAVIMKQGNNKTSFAHVISGLMKRHENPSQSDEYETFHKRNRKVVILYWSKAFSFSPVANFNPHAWPFFYAGHNCPTPCELTTDKRRVHEASALVVHARNANELPPKSYKNLTWILHSNENPIYTPSLHNPNFMGHFNYSATYRLDSDFPCPEFVKPNLDPPVPFQEKKGLVVAVLSNCEPVRTKYLTELMKHIQVDSYGACLRNKMGLIPRINRTSRHAVMELQRGYKFAVVFPNADCDFYMTEKIYNALSAGAVPIWLGTDGIDEVLKWGNLKHAVIKVKDFASPKALAEFLLKLAENEAEYNKYLKWKYEGFQFPKEYYESAIGEWWDGLPLYCRVCMRVAVDPRGHQGLPVDKCDGKQRRTVEKWLSNATLSARASRH